MWTTRRGGRLAGGAAAGRPAHPGASPRLQRGCGQGWALTRPKGLANQQTGVVARVAIGQLHGLKPILSTEGHSCFVKKLTETVF